MLTNELMENRLQKLISSLSREWILLPQSGERAKMAEMEASFE
jgi:hypothetical protein